MKTRAVMALAGMLLALSVVPLAATGGGEKAPGELVTLRILEPGGPVNYQEGVQDDPVAKEIERLTGVRMNILSGYMDDQRYLAIMASGDIPDILWVRKPFFKQVIPNLLPLDALVQKYGTNIRKNVPRAVKFSKEFWSDDSHQLYILPGCIAQEPGPDESGGNTPFFIRWDWYKEAGYPQWKTLDEVGKIVLDVWQKHPQTPDGRKMYAVGFWTDWGLLPYWIMSGFFQGGSEMNWVDQEKYKYLDPQNPTYLGARYFSTMQRAGALDPDSFTQKWDAYRQKNVDGRYVQAYFVWGGASDFNAAMVSAGTPEKGYGLMMPAAGTPRFPIHWFAPIGNTATQFGIGKTTKQAEAAMKFLDRLYAVEWSFLTNSGIKGKDWVVENGKNVYTPEAIKAITTDPNYVLNTGIMKYNNLAGLFNTNLSPQMPSDPATYTALEKDWLQLYKVPADTPKTSWQQFVLKQRVKDYVGNAIFQFAFPAAPDDIARMEGKITDYLMEELPKLIIAARSDAEWNAGMSRILDGVKGLGGDKVDEWNRTQEKIVKDAIKKLN